MSATWKALKPGDVYQDTSGHFGTVLINFETGACADGYSPEGWDDQPGGLLIACPDAGLVRVPEATLSGHDRPWRNFYGRRHGKRLRKGQAALLESHLADLAPPGIGWAENPGRTALNLATLYPEARAIWLEIGFGGGEHMLAQAKANPDVQIIGADPFINGVAKLLAAIERAGVANLAVTDQDARDLMDVLPDGGVDRVFLLYPDPWPKTRHHKRRFVNPDQVDMMARVMAPGAHLRVATDIEDYVRHTLEVLGADVRFRWTAEGPADWRRAWQDWPGTRYEAKALREGRTPHYLTFRRV